MLFFLLPLLFSLRYERNPVLPLCLRFSLSLLFILIILFQSLERFLDSSLSLSLVQIRVHRLTATERVRGGTLPLGLRLKKNVLLFERLSEHDRRHTAVFSLTRTTPTTLFRIDPFPFLSCSFPSLSPLFALLTTVFL